MEHDRRELPAGGRREYDPPAVPLREHLETIIRGSQIQIELEIATLAAKVTEFMATQSREHREVIRRLEVVETKVDGLESVEDRRRGGTVVLGRGWAVLIGLATLGVSIAAVVIAATS